MRKEWNFRQLDLQSKSEDHRIYGERHNLMGKQGHSIGFGKEDLSSEEQN